MNMKTTSLVLFSHIMSSVFGRPTFDINTGISSYFDDNYYSGNRRGRCGGSNLGRAFNRPSGRNHFDDNLLIPLCTINSRSGALSQHNLLVCNFLNLQHYLQTISKYDNDYHSTMHVGSNYLSEISIKVYNIFKRCIFLVRNYEYIEYKEKFEQHKYNDCFYILLNNVELTNFVFEYFRTLRECNNANMVLGSNYFYNSTQGGIADLDLNIRITGNICSADFLNDPKCILEINLYDRVELIKFFIQRHLCETYGPLNSTLLERFFSLYESVFLRGRFIDHQITAFVLYKLYAELRFDSNEINVIDSLSKFLSDYLTGRNLAVARTFCALTFGSVRK